MRIIFTLALVTGLLNSVWAENNKTALPGVYVVLVEGHSESRRHHDLAS